MNRPKIKLKLSSFDWLVEILAAIALIILIVITLIHYSELPDKVPVHFNISGEPDSYAGKMGIWILSIVGTVLYIGLTILNRFPHAFNYTAKITMENAEILYKISTQLVRVLKLVMLGLFNYINYQMIEVALQHKQGIGKYFIWIYLAFLFAVLFFYIYKIAKAKKATT